MSFFLSLLGGVAGRRDRRRPFAWSIGAVVVTIMIVIKLSTGGVVMAEDTCPDPILDAGKSVRDTTIYENGSLEVASSSTVMVVDLDESTTGGEARALLKFNTLLPPNAHLIHATLVLSATKTGGKVRGHRLLTGWEEDNVSWGDITNGEPWETGASFELSGKKNMVSADVTADVEAWHNGFAVNNGWILMTTSSKERPFYTSDFRKRTRRPGLVLEYCDACPLLKDQILSASKDNRSESCRNFFAAGCSAVDHGVQEQCPTSPFGNVIKFGRLKMAFTSTFQWRWDDKGSGGRDDGSFYHPLCPIGFFPLGSVAKGDYDKVDGTVAAMCFQDAGNAGLLALPVGWKKVWDDRGSGADEDGSCWRAECPSGYVALGDVFVTGYNEPNLFEIACVRQDLTDASSMRNVPVWTDIDTDSRKKFSAWQVESSLSDGRVAVNSFAGIKSYDKPDDALAINMWLPRKKGKVCSPKTKDKCDPCKVLKEEILILTDGRDRCRAFEEAGCSTFDLGNDELCPPPFPVASAEVEPTTPVCDIGPSDPNDVPFDDVISITRGTDGKYYVVGEVDGMFKLIIMDIVIRIFTQDTTAQCSLEVVQECSFPFQFIQAVAVAEPEGGTAQVYIAGQDKADGSPFISLVAPSDEKDKCDVVANSIDFVLPRDGEDGDATPFFDGLTTGPIRRTVLWSATQTSLYRPNETETSLGDFQYYLTPFQLGSGKAVADGEFLYFAETTMPEEESDSFVLYDNKLVDVVALDDYGSFLTMESGFVLEKGAPTMAPTDPLAPSPTNPIFEGFDDFGPLSLDTEETPPPAPVTSIPAGEDEYVSTVGPRTCFYRTYIEVLFAKVGVARKDLIECVAEEYTAVGTGAAEVLDSQSSSRALFEQQHENHRALEETKQDSNPCTDDNEGKLLVIKKAEDAGRFAGRKIVFVRDHLFTCRECSIELAEDVGGVFDVQKASRQNANVIKIESLANEASKNTASFDVSRKRVNSKACSLVIGNMADLDEALEECEDGKCNIGFDLPLLWQTRGTTINFCCAAYNNKDNKKKKDKF